MGVIHLKAEEFDQEVIKSKIPVIVDFFAEWCGPCQAMVPIFEEISEKFKNKIKFIKINVDESQEIAQNYSVMSIPTLIIFKDGKVNQTLVGLQNSESLVTILELSLIHISEPTRPY